MKTTRTHPYKKLLKRLVDARKERSISQAALGELLGKPQSFVAKVEGAERRLDVYEFVQWAKALQVDAGALVTEMQESGLQSSTRLMPLKPTKASRATSE